MFKPSKITKLTAGLHVIVVVYNCVLFNSILTVFSILNNPKHKMSIRIIVVFDSNSSQKFMANSTQR